MTAQQVGAEVACGIVPNRVYVLRLVLSVIVLDYQVRTVQAVIVQLSGSRSPAQAKWIRSRPASRVRSRSTSAVAERIVPTNSSMIRHQEVAVRFGHRQQERGRLAAAGCRARRRHLEGVEATSETPAASTANCGPAHQVACGAASHSRAARSI